MNNTCKAISLFAALLTLLCACNDTSDRDAVTTNAAKDTTAAVTEAPDYILPEYDFSGEAFAILAGEGQPQSLVEGETGDILNDAKYKMERTVEEAYNVEISETVTEFWGMPETVNTLIMSGDTTYDIISMMDRFAVSCAKENCFLPLQDVEEIRTSEPWWGEKLTDYLTIANNLYFAIGSHNLHSIRKTACMFMNSRLAAAYEINAPYEDILAGTWTLDDIYALKGIATADLNGDSVMDLTDAFTLGVGDIRYVISQYWTGFGEKSILKNEDDIPYVTLYDNERFIDILTIVHDLYFAGENDVASLIDYPDSSSTNGVSTDFMSGNILLTTGSISALENFREMEDDFYILPMPKYDEAQASYYSYTDDATYSMIPTTQEDITFAGAVLDALACVGYYDLVPTYIDVTLKDKFARDQYSKEIIQICIDSRTVDMTKSVIYNMIDGEYMHTLARRGINSAASGLERDRKKVERELQKVVDMFTALS